MALHPVGRLPASTYWRRRLVLLLAVVVVVLLVRAVLPGGDGGTDRLAGPSPTPTVTRSASPRPTASPAAPGTCRDAALTLTVEPEAGQHVAGKPVRLTVTVKNVSRTPCRRDLGGKVLEVLVRSGDDRIWSSDDCSTDHASSVQLLRAGASLQTTVTWQGRRSARGCPTPSTEAKPGTYTVRARLGTLRSDASVLRLTSA
jgi:hypothetical protein